MISRATVIWMLLAIAAGASLFVLKYEVKSMEEELARVHQETLANLEAVHVLKAEWSYLNRPSRLEDLGRRLLALGPVDATQNTTIDDIPLRQDPAPSLSEPSPPDGQGAPQRPGLVQHNSPAAGQVPPLLATFSTSSTSSISSRRAQ